MLTQPIPGESVIQIIQGLAGLAGQSDSINLQ